MLKMINYNCSVVYVKFQENRWCVGLVEIFDKITLTEVGIFHCSKSLKIASLCNQTAAAIQEITCQFHENKQ